MTYKTAGVDNDTMAQAVTGPLYTIGTLGIAPVTGTITGLSRKPMKNTQQVQGSKSLSWLPGVAQDRMLRRRTGLSARLGAGKSKAVSEQFGTATSLAAATLLGAGLGAVITPITQDSSMQFGIGRGAFVGGSAAAALALILKLTAKGQRARSLQEQKAYQHSAGDTVANWLIPGAAAYNSQMAQKRMLADQAIAQYKQQQKQRKTAAEQSLFDVMPRDPVQQLIQNQYRPVRHLSDFKPIHVGTQGQYDAAQAPVIHHWRNALIGLGLGAGAGALSYVVLRNRIKEKNKKQYKKKLAKTIVASAGIGLGTGAVTMLALAAADTMRGTNMTHKYRIPDANTDGSAPDIAIHYVGGGGGAQTDSASSVTPNLDRIASAARYGANRTYLLNPNDQYYGRELIDKIHKAVPNARIRISGHSHGGAAAYRLAQYAASKGIAIDQLDTLDPIANLTPMSGKPDTVRRWNNYRLSQYTKDNSGNLWAILGGRKGKLEGSVDHVFGLGTPYYNHTEMRYVPFDQGIVPYDTYKPKSVMLQEMLRLTDEMMQQRQHQKETNK